MNMKKAVGVFVEDMKARNHQKALKVGILDTPFAKDWGPLELPFERPTGKMKQRASLPLRPEKKRNSETLDIMWTRRRRILRTLPTLS